MNNIGQRFFQFTRQSLNTASQAAHNAVEQGSRFFCPETPADQLQNANPRDNGRSVCEILKAPILGGSLLLVSKYMLDSGSNPNSVIAMQLLIISAIAGYSIARHVSRANIAGNQYIPMEMA